LLRWYLHIVRLWNVTPSGKSRTAMLAKATVVVKMATRVMVVVVGATLVAVAEVIVVVVVPAISAVEAAVVTIVTLLTKAVMVAAKDAMRKVFIM